MNDKFRFETAEASRKFKDADAEFKDERDHWPVVKDCLDTMNMGNGNFNLGGLLALARKLKFLKFWHMRYAPM